MPFLVDSVVVGHIESVGESLEWSHVRERIDPVTVRLGVMCVMKSAVGRVGVLVAVDVRNIFPVLVVNPRKRRAGDELVEGSVLDLAVGESERGVGSQFQPFLHLIVKVHSGTDPVVARVHFHDAVLIEISHTGHGLKFVGASLETELMAVI